MLIIPPPFAVASSGVPIAAISIFLSSTVRVVLFIVVVVPLTVRFPATVTAPVTAACSGETITLTASTSDSYAWSNGATTRTISVKASGKYFVTVANASGCSTSDTSVVSVINANILQSDTTICRVLI